MNRLRQWYDLNRTPIGYAVGGINLLNGLFLFSVDTLAAIFWFMLGLVIIFDTKYYK